MNQQDIVRDPEIAALLVPLTTQEESLLAESLRREGCTDPLTVWAGTNILLDGHVRFRICQAEGIPFAVAEVELADRNAARQWVWQRQAGRRNLRPVAAAYAAGVVYLSVGKHPGARTDLTSGQDARRLVSEDVARFFGLDESTVRRHARFARDLDLIAAELGEEFRRSILTGQARLSRRQIATLAGMSRSDKERYLQKLAKEKEQARAARRKPAIPTAEQPASDERPSPSSTPPALAMPASPDLRPLADQASGNDLANRYDPDEDAVGNRDDDFLNETAGQDDEAAIVEDPVDEDLLAELEELFHQADHATRLKFLGGPLVRTALDRLKATPAMSA